MQFAESCVPHGRLEVSLLELFSIKVFMGNTGFILVGFFVAIIPYSSNPGGGHGMTLLKCIMMVVTGVSSAIWGMLQIAGMPWQFVFGVGRYLCGTDMSAGRYWKGGNRE